MPIQGACAAEPTRSVVVILPVEYTIADADPTRGIKSISELYRSCNKSHTLGLHISAIDDYSSAAPISREATAVGAGCDHEDVFAIHITSSDIGSVS